MDIKTIKTVVVEDEQEALDLLSGLVEATGMATVIAATTDPYEAVDLVTLHNPDILFLDIHMPGMSGFDILNELRRIENVDPHVVFTTAHDEYAITAFDYAAFDYLLKPIDPARLRDTLQRFAKDGKNVSSGPADNLLENERILVFRGITGVTFIDTEEVVYVTADGNYSNFHFASGRVETVTALIGTLEAHLGKQFFRTGRSCIINTSCLVRIETKQLQCVLIKNGKEYRCEITRDRIRQLMDHMKHRITET